MKKANARIEYWVDRVRNQGLKLTPTRMELLRLLTSITKPMSIQEVSKKMHQKKADQATLYRSLEAFADAEIVRRVDFHHGHAHYEINDLSRHHHHIVCQNCGEVEDVEASRWVNLSAQALKQSKKFTVIRDHSIEFFGLCRNCAKGKVNA